jgi:hypothetical protein
VSGEPAVREDVEILKRAKAFFVNDMWRVNGP